MEGVGTDEDRRNLRDNGSDGREEEVCTGNSSRRERGQEFLPCEGFSFRSSAELLERTF